MKQLRSWLDDYKRVSSPAAINRAELPKRIRASIKFNDYDQMPQLEAPAEKKKKKVLE